MDDTLTMPAPAEAALPQGFPPAVLGYAYQPRPRTYREAPSLHRADTRQFVTPEGLHLSCTSGFALRIANPRAMLPGIDEYGRCDELVLLTALARVAPARLCRRGCFSAELVETYTALRHADPLVTQMLIWEHVTGRRRREVTMSADAAAVIAEAVSCSATRPTSAEEPTGQPRTEPVTVTLSGHADAVIAGLVGPPDTGNSSVADDRERVWKRGICASDATWAEVGAAFPSSLATERGMTAMDFDAVLAEVREAFPLSVFRQWADASLRFADHDISMVWDNLAHYYDPEAGT